MQLEKTVYNFNKGDSLWLMKYKKLNKQQQLIIQQQQDMITTNDIKLEQYSKKVFEYKKTIEALKEIRTKLANCDLD